MNADDMKLLDEASQTLPRLLHVKEPSLKSSPVDRKGVSTKYIYISLSWSLRMM